MKKEFKIIPDDVSFEFDNLLNFVEKREQLLKMKIMEAFPSDFNQLVTRYVLQDKLD